MTLELPVPEPVTNRQMPVETNPKTLKSWLVSLPPSNVLESGRAIYDSLATLNRTRLDADSRTRLLEHYQVSSDMLDAPLEATYGSATVPARDKAKQTAALARNLQLELLNGYKLVLQERQHARFSRGTKYVPGLLQRLYMCYHKLMWVCYKSYAAIPKGIWAEIHTIFLYAIQNKLIDAPEDAAQPIQTVGGWYKQMLLLSLVDPYRFHPAELEKIQDLIRNYGAHAQFAPLGSMVHPAGFFLIRLDKDAPPAFLSQRPVDVQASSAILLETVEMVRMLGKAQQAVEQKLPTASDKPKALAWLELMRRVTRQWSIAPKRVFQRIRANSRVQVTGGLRMTAFYFNGAKPLLQPIVLDADMPGDVLEITEHGPATQSGPEKFSPPDEWVVLNESPGGYALHLFPLRHYATYRVGDIVGLHVTQVDGWMVGTVRWVQTVEDGEALEMGVQILAPTAESAMLRPTIAAPGTTFQPALLLPAVPALKQPPLVVAPRATFSPMRELTLYTFDGDRLLRASRLQEQTIGYDLFEYRQL